MQFRPAFGPRYDAMLLACLAAIPDPHERYRQSSLLQARYERLIGQLAQLRAQAAKMMHEGGSSFAQIGDVTGRSRARAQQLVQAGRGTRPTECVFCGGTPLTKEHIWPRWLQDLVVMEPRDHTVGGVGPRAERRRFSAPPFTTVARVVCERCNSGWMAELEGAAKEFVAPMIEAKPAILTPVNQQLVATWAIKTAMMMQLYAHPGGLAIPADHYRQVHDRPAPPDYLWVWLASQTSGEVRYWLRPLALASLSEPTPRRPNGYWVTMSVGALVIQILGATRPLPEHVLEDLPVVSTLGLRRIWPSSGDIKWPILPPLTDENVDQLLAAFDHIQPLEWLSDDD